MENINVITIIGIISFFVCCLLILFILTVKTKKKLSNYLFAFFLTLVALDICGWFINTILNTPKCLVLFRSNLTFLQLPLFYLYILSVCFSDFRLKRRHLLHAIPFLIVNIILIPNFYAADLDAQFEFLENATAQIEIQSIHLFIHIQVAFYFILIFLTLNRFKKLYRQNYTSSGTKIFTWLFQISIIFLMFHIIALFKNVFKFSSSLDVFNTLQTLAGLFVLGIICWYVLKALNHPELFRGIDSKLKLITILKTEEGPDEHQSHTDLDKLKSYMIEKEPYLEPTLSLQNLANELEIPSRELSILINTHVGQHFFDFINHYRIEKAKMILRNKDLNQLTVLEILYDVGFNSKSSFNTAFKKHTDVTPTQYRKRFSIAIT